jgi:hypothetical protein
MMYHSPLGRPERRVLGRGFSEADYHFIIGIRDWAGTSLDISAEPKQIDILNEQLFNHPLIYFVEPGYMDLSDEEAQRCENMRYGAVFLFGRLLGQL